jgi:hypothetical protein
VTLTTPFTHANDRGGRAEQPGVMKAAMARTKLVAHELRKKRNRAAVRRRKELAEHQLSSGSAPDAPATNQGADTSNGDDDNGESHRRRRLEAGVGAAAAAGHDDDASADVNEG